MCNATVIKDYDEWLEMCQYLHCSNYDGDKAIAYPNPSSGPPTVELDPDYISICNVLSVTYKVYDLYDYLYGSEFSHDPTDNFSVKLDPLYFPVAGTYVIMCEVQKANSTLNETFSILFIRM